ncbi:MAG: pentapeptide repeat-containing protein [Cyanobacteria bacterium J06626_4]
MTEPGKYHGQWLKAKEVMQLYAVGERDFRGAILRGGNFSGADLSGADFSGADIRSAQFVEATLQGVTFCQAKAGLQRRWFVGQLALVMITAAMSGVLQGFAGAWLGFLLVVGSLTNFSAAITGIVFIVIMLFVIARQGFTLKAMGSVTVAFAFAFAAAFAFTGAGAFSVTGDVAVAAAFAIAIAVTVAVAATFTGAVAAAVAVAVAAAVAVAFVFANTGTGPAAFAGPVTFAGPVFFLSLYINRRIHQDDPRFANLRVIGLAFIALGGTTFSGADLTGSSFIRTHLKSANFADSPQRSTLLAGIRWHDAQKLDRARLGINNLQDRRVRILLTSLNGIDQDLTNADLQGVNLAGAQLHRNTLKGVNLNGATLAGAELHGANLTEAQCIGTDFTAAQLTGACLEAWNIDDTTILRDIDCQYVFLKAEPDAQGDRERRPHDPDKIFQPGDFEKFFKEMLDTVQILIRNGVDPGAFKAAFEQVMADNPAITRESVQAMEKQGDDVLLTLQVPEGIDKGQVERSWDDGYQRGLKEGYNSGLLEGQTQRADDVKEVALGFGQLLSSIQITNMNNPINTGDGGFINTGSMQGNVVNLGELSGQITVQINQLPDTVPDSDQPNLKSLLTQLQQATAADIELTDDEKAEALGEVAKLAKAGTNPKDNAMQRMAKRATDALKSITEPLTEASKLAEVCQSLLPAILTLF